MRIEKQEKAWKKESCYDNGYEKQSQVKGNKVAHRGNPFCGTSDRFQPGFAKAAQFHPFFAIPGIPAAAFSLTGNERIILGRI